MQVYPRILIGLILLVSLAGQTSAKPVAISTMHNRQAPQTVDTGHTQTALQAMLKQHDVALDHLLADHAVFGTGPLDENAENLTYRLSRPVFEAVSSSSAQANTPERTTPNGGDTLEISWQALGWAYRIQARYYKLASESDSGWRLVDLRKRWLGGTQSQSLP